MPTSVEKAPMIEALVAQWQVIDDLVSSISDEQWQADSGLPGWNVADVVAHIVGTESMLDGREADSVRDVSGLPHVKNSIGELNERWLDHYRSRSRDEVMADYREVTAKRAADMRAMTDDAWNVEMPTPAGRDTFGRFMRVRNFDCWVHEMDLRDALGLGEPTAPEPATWALQEMTATIPFLVGKKAGAPKGSAATFDFSGLVPMQVHVAVDEKASAVPALDAPADVTLSLTVVDFARLAGDRPKADPADVVIAGDAELGSAIVTNLHYMI
ncbi:maleylpyruvate isomerase family mycothiol-dependent enzyme [Gordonia zhaorongruii]|uniref:maleylpyruvate isomerase family mycothiol-dependent enzyme n=1 Tax=Gordonia zhaorongruii TaxID=2597659 RepID=UPI0010435A28|nr:maleylpyruvate isomerase family mycothiol-dependent enzyme [Gordonia zhaorongruii]